LPQWCGQGRVSSLLTVANQACRGLMGPLACVGFASECAEGFVTIGVELD